MKFKVFHLRKKWEGGIGIPNDLVLNSGRKVVNKIIFLKLVKEADKIWRTKIEKKVKL